MIEFIAFVLVMILFGLSVYLNLYQYTLRKRLLAKLVQESIKNYIISERLSKEMESKDTKTLEQTEGFVNFLSQSRDWAFEYIEDAQDKLAIFNKELLNILNTGKNKKEITKQILEAYKPIQELLPNEQGEK